MTRNSGHRGTCRDDAVGRELRKVRLAKCDEPSRAASTPAARVGRCTARGDLFGHLVSVLTPGGFAAGLLARDQSEVRAALPSDCPRLLCQGSELPAEAGGSADIKGRLADLGPAVTWFRLHLAQGNICPSH